MARGAAGRRNRGKSSQGLGARDPRWDRNARVATTLQDQYSDQFQVNRGNGVLELKDSAVLGLLTAQPPIQLRDGSFSLAVAGGLELFRGALQVRKGTAVDDLATGATTAQAVDKINELLASLRAAGLLEF